MSYKKIKIANVNDLQNGEMKSVKVEDHKILLSKINNKFYAVGAQCPHSGAPLETGVLHDDTIVCPWHHACFNAKTGALLEPPSLDSLASHEVVIEGEDVILNVVETVKERKAPNMVRHDSDKDNRTFVILGAGAAGDAAAYTLRENAFYGKIIMIGRESFPPYDRTLLSKFYLMGNADKSWLPLRTEEFHDIYDIDLMLDKNVTKVDTLSKTVSFENDETLNYDKILLATGGIPKTLQIPGKDLNNIFTLRSLSDADHILSALEKAAKVVVVGASFIGMETAASLKQKGLEVTVVAPEDIPFAHVFGEQVGKMFLDLHKEKDVQFYLGSSVSEFKGNSNVQQVILEDGKMLDADLVLVGVGIRPATDYIKGKETLKDGGIAVDKHFKAADDVYAAGDIVRFPYWRNRQDIRIEHWRTAEQQGRIAALNMTGKDLEYKSVPFFWTMQSGVHFRYVGHTKTWDKVIIDGNVKAKKFMAYYIHNNKIKAVAGIQRDKEVAAVHELMRTNRMPPVSLVKEGKVDWLKRIRIST